MLKLSKILAQGGGGERMNSISRFKSENMGGRGTCTAKDAPEYVIYVVFYTRYETPVPRAGSSHPRDRDDVPGVRRERRTGALFALFAFLD